MAAPKETTGVIVSKPMAAMNGTKLESCPKYGIMFLDFGRRVLFSKRVAVSNISLRNSPG